MNQIIQRINWIKLKYYEKAFIIEKAPIIPPSEVKEPERKESSSSLRKPIGHITIKQILIELNEKRFFFKKKNSLNSSFF